jgi:ribosomal subunit interface protein
MSKRIYFKDTQHSSLAENYANEKLVKIEKFLAHESTPITIDLTFYPSKVHEHHRVELLIKTPHYNVVSAYEHEGTEFYEVIDRVIETAYRELLKQKERRIDERKNGDGHHRGVF